MSLRKVAGKEPISSKSLDLSGKKLVTLEETTFGTTSPTVDKLSLSSNSLSSLPWGILHQAFPNIRALHLSKNSLTAIPSEISIMVNLEKLDLSYNQIRTIGDQFGGLAMLRKLDLTANGMDTVPESVSALPALEILILAKNQIHSLPTHLGQLSKLQVLELAGNPLISPPASVITKGCPATLSYLRNLSTTFGGPVHKFRPARPNEDYNALVTTPNPFSPDISKKNPKTIYRTLHHNPAPNSPHTYFYVTHSVFADQGAREYMEDKHTCLNHIELGPLAIRPRRKKGDTSEDASDAASSDFGSGLDDSVASKPGAPILAEVTLAPESTVEASPSSGKSKRKKASSDNSESPAEDRKSREVQTEEFPVDSEVESTEKPKKQKKSKTEKAAEDSQSSTDSPAKSESDTEVTEKPKKSKKSKTEKTEKTEKSEKTNGSENSDQTTVSDNTAENDQSEPIGDDNEEFAAPISLGVSSPLAQTVVEEPRPAVSPKAESSKRKRQSDPKPSAGGRIKMITSSAPPAVSSTDDSGANGIESTTDPARRLTKAGKSSSDLAGKDIHKPGNMIRSNSDVQFQRHRSPGKDVDVNGLRASDGFDHRRSGTHESTDPVPESLAYFAVYDGHAGGRCSEYLKHHLHEELLELKETRTGEIPLGLYKSYLKTERYFTHTAKQQQWNDGSTSVSIVIHQDRLIAAHVGDSRAVLCRGKKAIGLTSDHKPDRPDEEKRIQAAGGSVLTNTSTGWIARVNGHLAVSRAFGDLKMKEPTKLVSAEPEVVVVPLSPSDQFVVLASDGLWDVCSNQEAVDVIRKYTDKNKAAEHLAKKALKIGTTDNITVVVVWFTWAHDSGVERIGKEASMS